MAWPFRRVWFAWISCAGQTGTVLQREEKGRWRVDLGEVGVNRWRMRRCAGGDQSPASQELRAGAEIPQGVQGVGSWILPVTTP